jgi:hypothetical protein
MDIFKIFNEFLENLEIQNKNDISIKCRAITKRLNRTFYGIESETNNTLKVGSYGRKTAINGVSDLDLIFVMSDELFRKYNSYESNGQSALLQDIKNAILETYPKTDIRGDGQVVVVSFFNYVIEICPTYPNSKGSFRYPDSNNGGSWKITNPSAEINEIKRFDESANGNLINLAKMARAWKNKNGVKIGGLLIDTLCYEFLDSNEDLKDVTLNEYDGFILKFFEFLKDYDKQREYWFAPGSRQKVYRKGSNFISKARKAYKIVQEAVEKGQNDTVYGIWKKVFGYPFPYPKAIKEASDNYTDHEEYIEDKFSVDIRFELKIDCEVSQSGFRTEFLRNMSDKLRVQKSLKFFIVSTDVPKPYNVKWKVKNEGLIAKKRNDFRGQILNDRGKEVRTEKTTFAGSHFVECYIIKNDVCVARDRIDVPISHL